MVSGRTHAHSRSSKKSKKSAAADAVDAGVADLAEEPDDGRVVVDSDAGVAVVAAPRTVRERIIGTWVLASEADVVPVHSMCASGAWVVRYEATGDVGAVEPMRGRWDVADGEPPKLLLTLPDDERQEGTINKLTDEAAEVTLEDEELKFTRRSKTANCE